LPLFPNGTQIWLPVMIILSVVAILYGGAVSVVQKDLKKLVAYSSVAHMGFVTLGIFVLNTQGAVGAVLQMLNHGFVTGALFLFVGIQYEKTHRRLIADLGGMANRWPLYTTFFGIFMLASLGLPGLNGFVGEFLVLLGTFQFSGVPLGGLFWGPLAALGVILAAVYMLWMFQRVMYGPVREAYKSLPDLNWLEVACAVPLLVLTVLLGLFPQPAIAIIEPSLDRILRLATDPTFQLALR
jgi:NADH-quinone oxidoreductase subunit M